MSINSMTNIALKRRTGTADSPPADPSDRRVMADAAEGEPTTAQSPVTAALAVVVSYIPTEVLALYVAILAAVNDPQNPSASLVWGIFVAFLIATPIIVWMVYAAKVRSEGKPLPKQLRQWPIWEMVAGTVAYAAWAVSLPDAVILESLGWPTPLAAVIVLTISAALGLFAPLFQHPIASQ